MIYNKVYKESSMYKCNMEIKECVDDEFIGGGDIPYYVEDDVMAQKCVDDELIAHLIKYRKQKLKNK